MSLRKIWPFAALAALAACQNGPPPVSLQQAKNIAAEFKGQSFTAPPRTIADITAILDEQKPDPAIAVAARAKADAPVPKGLAGAELAHFYYERGIAASDIGRSTQWIADLKKAVEIARASQDVYDGLPRYLNQYAKALLRNGRPFDARKIYAEHMDLVAATGKNQGQLFTDYMFVADISESLGDIPAATKWIDRGESLLTDAHGWRRGMIWSYYGDMFQATVAAGKARLALATGHMAEAEKSFHEAEAFWSQGAAKYPTIPATLNRPPEGAWAVGAALMHTFLAHTLTAQGRMVEAEVEARRGLLALLRLRGRYSTETAGAVEALVRVLLEEERNAEAAKLARAAIDIYVKIGHGKDSVKLAMARLRLARTQLSQGQYAAALATYERVDRDTRSLGPAWHRRLFGGTLAYGIALTRNGRYDDALAAFRQVAEQRLRQFGPHNYAAAEAQGFLGAALARKGDQAAALKEFRAAIPILLAPSRDVEDEDTIRAAKDRRLQFIIESYIRLLVEARGTPEAKGIDIAGETFRLADAIRGRSVQRALAASSARAAASDPALAQLVRDEQDARKQIGALQGVLNNALSVASDQRDDKALVALRTRIDTLRGARAAIRQEIEKRFPDYVNLIDPRPATVAQVQKALHPGEALIATFVGTDRSFVWAVPQKGPVAFAAVGRTGRQMARDVVTLRRALEPNASTLGEIPPFDVALAHDLYAELLEPVADGWHGAKSLLIVPHGPLGQLPFTVLVTKPVQLAPDREGEPLFADYRLVPFLVRTEAVTQLPSVSSLIALRALSEPKGVREPFVGFGDPWFNNQEAAEATEDAERPTQLVTRGARTLVAMRGVRLVRRSIPKTENADSAVLSQLPRLPDTAAEVRAVAIALHADPAKDVFTGRQANEQRVETMDLSNRKVVMFATHGLVPGDLNGLTQPALALTAPRVAGVGGDGLLTLDEVLALRLNADWVVLSACNTAAGDGAGAEAVSGLGRAFFYAGTRALLVSNWPVETTSARALTTDLFRREAADPKLTRAEAERDAELALIDGPGFVDHKTKATVFSYAHPIFWAPFSLVGDGGR